MRRVTPRRCLVPRWLAAGFSRLGPSDHGAVAIVVALLLTPVLLGFAVLVVDGGQLFDEHRQLRSGADAAAVAVAQLCAQQTTCASAATTRAKDVAQANDSTDSGSGGAVVVDRVCGTLRDLPACPARPSNAPALSSCPAWTPYVYYAEVRLRTGTPDGRNVITTAFSNRSVPVASCARAGAAAPTSLTSALPVTIAKCVIDAYKAKSGHNSDLAPEPPYGSNRSTWETAVVTSNTSDSCTGQRYGGNYGTVDDGKTYDAGDGTSKCPVTTTVGSTVTGGSSSLTSQCSTSTMNALLNTIVFLPVFETVSGTSSAPKYLVTGYAPFFLTGWRFSKSNYYETSVTSSVKCSSSSTCLYGMYTRGFAPAPGPFDPSTDPRPLGTAVVKLVG